MNSEEWRKIAENATAELRALVFWRHNLGLLVSPQEEKAVKDAYEILRRYFTKEEEGEREPDASPGDYFDEFMEF